MIFSHRINEAIKIASHLHRNQVRKDKERTPYISHLVSVAFLISTITEDEDIIIAGLMHDSLEDVPFYSYEKLVNDFGERVASIVYFVTEPLNPNKEADEQLPWLERKKVYLELIEKGGIESAIVSCADKIHNTESFIEEIKKDDGTFLLKFHSSLRNRLWFHEEVYKIIEKKLGQDNSLVKRLDKAINEASKISL